MAKIFPELVTDTKQIQEAQKIEWKKYTTSKNKAKPTYKHLSIPYSKQNKTKQKSKDKEKIFKAAKGKNKHLTNRGRRIWTIAETMQTRRH